MRAPMDRLTGPRQITDRDSHGIAKPGVAPMREHRSDRMLLARCGCASVI
jgi:hypothetical protein